MKLESLPVFRYCFEQLEEKLKNDLNHLIEEIRDDIISKECKSYKFFGKQIIIFYFEKDLFAG